MNYQIGIAGAGAIGCFFGGLLLDDRQDVVFLGREKLGRELKNTGLRLTDCDGGARDISRERIHWSALAEDLGAADIVLVTVKSTQTAEMALALKAVLKPGSLIVSFQNGVRNAVTLRENLENQIVLAGMVPFNVVSRGPGQFHRATTGATMIEERSDARVEYLKASLTRTGLEIVSSRDMRGVQFAKLILNLNNPLNALCGWTLKRQLEDKSLRRIYAALVDEALRVFKAAGIKPARLTPVPIGLLPSIMRLPAPLFQLVAASQIKIDPEARLSMWQDLEARRETENGFLCGEVIRLAEQTGQRVPVNQVIFELVRKAEIDGSGSPKLSPEFLLKQTGLG